ncbi:hypothetical protein BH09VER1_BH09VER1_17960 [soil metagenome]
MHRAPSKDENRVDSYVQFGSNSCGTPRHELLGEDLLMLTDVMLYTKLSRRKLQIDVAAGALAVVKFGRATRFYPEDVHAYVKARRISRQRR